jgi:4-amino-4-deoxy-L-arabinose transferase-like glycosyltransferase
MNSPQTVTSPGPSPAIAGAAGTPALSRRLQRLREMRLAPRHFALAAILALSALLNVNRLSQNGYAGVFYSAGIRSMLRSLHNFVFVSFDPGGLVSVDKPPLGLWVQAASAKVFGFSPLSLLLPEAIAGVLSVALLYHMLFRRFGQFAALAGALALAVSPSFVAVSRDNGVDPVLVLLMILACGAGMRAAETGRWRTLLWCGVLVGLAFNTKTLAAYLIVPGIALAYAVCAPGSILRRATQLLAAGLLMVVVSFSWITFVELTPASARPFVGSSTNNTELGLTFEYNGFGRVGGQTGGPGKIPVGTGALVPAAPPSAPHRRPPPAPRPRAAVVKPPARVQHLSATLRNGRDRNPIPFGGPPGPLRLFGIGLGDQGGWMIPFAFFGLLGVAITILLGAGIPSGSSSTGTGAAMHADSAGAQATGMGARLRRDPRLAGLLVLGGWFLLEAAVLSLSKGIVHPYYLSALAPGTAAMAGAGAVAFVQLATRRRRDWGLILAPVAILTTVAAQIVLLHREHYMQWFVPVLLGGAAVGIAALLVRRLAPWAMAATFCLLLVAPTAYASTTWLAPVEGTFPAAGPTQAIGAGGVGTSGAGLRGDEALVQYVRSHRPGSRWAVLTDSADTAAPMILLGLDAGALAGYSGIDPVIDGRGLARLVADGQARYVVLGGEFSQRGGNRATAAVLKACRELPSSAWQTTGTDLPSLTLFDCAGRDRALSAA